MLIGYARPYSSDPNCEEQHMLLTNMNCDKIVSEAHFSSKQRINLKNIINSLNPGDKVVVGKLFAFADSARHLVELLSAIEGKGAHFLSLKEGIDTSKNIKGSFKDIVLHIVEFESDIISEKTKEGINEAKQKGIVPGRPKIPDENVKRAIAMYQSKEYSLAEIKNETGISKSTLYRYLGK
ncbi:recombinase family protein [Bacillus sp. ISL-47]|uniref:recombinase family protein n=1 Tax=Bacillus sp. ISL-47 TaxID=2819130 RepID=UPI001BE50BAF|nr:recombinase family protein [Bacillus sp. ISL-47]MBT2690981.1 recombinase family protein [Bacillus sp. ISL-47]MBT2710400.1 recombinase family protein [Pseudomonas sp. ISL-84]